MTRPSIPVWLYPAIALTALLSSYSIYQRYQAESLNKATALAVELDVVEGLAASQGITTEVALQKLKDQGLTAVVLSEETVGDLIYRGEATMQNGEVVVPDPLSLTRVKRGTANRFGVPYQGASSGLNPALVRQTPIGLNPRQSEVAKAAGLTVVARMSNLPGATEHYVDRTLKWANELGATVFLPQGDQVLGRRDALKQTSETIKSLGMLYASPEFTKIGGDANMVGMMPERIVRLHSAQSAELDKLPLADAVDRYARAARERNMRMLLVRPVSYASAAPLDSFADFLRQINRSIRDEGGSIGEAKPFESPNAPRPIFLLIALSVIPTGWWVGSSLFSDRRVRYAGLALLTLLALAAWVRSGREFMALAAALIFPIAAFLVLDSRNAPTGDAAAPKRFILAEFMLTCLISLVGGLVVAGLLNELPYFVKAEVFPGVKLAVFLPIVVAGIYFFLRYADLKNAMKSPVTWSAAFLTIGMLAALALMATRTGNEGAGVSGVELQVRNLLDQFLYVRPRTKSFLIGHPMLIAGIGMLLWQRRTMNRSLGPWTALALTAGVIGQTDIVNTLCHLHTPVTLSLIRNAVALVPGCIIGYALWLLVKRVLPKPMGEVS